MSQRIKKQQLGEAALTAAMAAVLLYAAQGKHLYGFYIVLRLTATVGAAYWVIRIYRTGPSGWLWAFVAVALLMTPFLRIRMQRTQLQPIDLWLGMLLLGWFGYWLFREPHSRLGIGSER